MILPVDHILGGVDTPLLHPEEVGIILIMTRIDIHGTIVYHGCRVTGKPRLHKGVLRQTERRGKR